VIKAFRFGPGAPPPDWELYSENNFLLCDTYDPAAAGGTGRVFSPQLIPADFPISRAIIAGGLTPLNVADVIRIFCPFGVDVSSGVEIAPGRKSRELVENFIRAARAADQPALNGSCAGR